MKISYTFIKTKINILNSTDKQNFQLLDNLVSSLTNEEDPKRFGDIFQSINLPIEAYSNFCSWSSESYTRNCIFENEKFELILICWQKGQSTLIHDHGGEECWVKVVKGSFKETIYNLNKNNKLTKVKALVSNVNEVTYMIDFMGYHRLENLSDKNSISLHLYAKPIKICKVFDEDSKQFIHKKLSYNTAPQLVSHHKY